MGNANNKQRTWISLRQVLNKNKRYCVPAHLTRDGFNEFFSGCGVKLAEKFQGDRYEWNLPAACTHLHFMRLTMKK